MESLYRKEVEMLRFKATVSRGKVGWVDNRIDCLEAQKRRGQESLHSLSNIEAWSAKYSRTSTQKEGRSNRVQCKDSVSVFDD